MGMNAGFKTMLLGLAFAVGVMLPGAAAEFDATHIAKEAPDHVKLLMENDDVAVMEFTLAPGDALPEHPGGHRVVLSLSDYVIRFTEEGESFTQMWLKGNVHWHEAKAHAIENVGTTPAHYVIVVCKTLEHEEESSETEGTTLHEVAPGNACILFENDDVLVTKVTMQPGEVITEHGGYKRAVYSNSAYTLEYTDAEGTQQETYATGDVHWHDAGVHSLRNTGKSKASFIVVAWKR